MSLHSPMKDLEGCIQRVAAFLQKDLKTEDVKKIAKLCSFGEMKKNPSVNHQWLTDLKYRDPKGAEFLRKGGYNSSALATMILRIISGGTVV